MRAKTLKRHGYFWVGTLVVMALAFLMGVFLAYGPVSIEALRVRVDQSKWFLIGWRIACYSILVLIWPHIIKLAGKGQLADYSQRVPRFYIMVIIVVYEILVVQNALAFLFSKVMG